MVMQYRRKREVYDRGDYQQEDNQHRDETGLAESLFHVFNVS